MSLMSTKLKYIVKVFKLLPQFLVFGGGVLATVKKVSRIFQYEGWAGLRRRILFVEQTVADGACKGRFISDKKLNSYQEWVASYDTLMEGDREKIKLCIAELEYKPLFSVVMPVYNPSIEFFEEAIKSVRNQLYPNWELCIADDASSDPKVREIIEHHRSQDHRIKVIYRLENGHISKASNSALEMAQGEFIAMLDHDDLIPDHALYMYAEELNRCPDADFLYSDQDKIDTSGVRYDPYFKPDSNPDLLRSQNFVDHLAVFRASVVKNLGGWRSEFDGSQDYDLVLRVIERMPASKIRHIPFVLYHWRAVPGSLAVDAAAKNYAPVTSRKALAEHLQRLGIEAEVTSHHPHLSIHRVIYPLSIEPLVTVIIPTRDRIDLLAGCIDGVLHRTDYANLEIIIVNNQSVEAATRTYLDEIVSDTRVRVIDFDAPFNYSKINNLAVRQAKGSIIAFLNNDVEVINTDWLREMVSHAVRPEIGGVGARLYYPDDTVQHAGVLLGYKGRAGHMFRYTSRHWVGYWARGVLIQNLTAVTAACMVIRKTLFEQVGGFDEDNFTITFNDVDLCLRIHEKGLRNLYTPYAELYHHESKTRGLLAFQHEEDYFAEKWKKYIEHDPAYNLNLSLESERFELSFPPRVCRPWQRTDHPSLLRESPLVTIVTRTYGEREGFLREALASIFAQTYRPIEIVVVEDGGARMQSMVESILLPKEISIVYESLPKRGRCHAGNRGLELAQGEIVGFLDDDDLLLSDHVETLVRCLQLHKDAAGAYACSWQLPTEVISLSPLKYKVGRKRLYGRKTWSLSRLWSYNFITIQSLLFKKELYNRFGGFHEHLDCLEDWDLWLRYTAEMDLVYLDKPTSEFKTPRNRSTLLKRNNEHLRYMPMLRDRQKKLLERYKNTPYYQRLQAASAGTQEFGQRAKW